MILVDGNNYLARYFFQLKSLVVDGKNVGGMYGFLRGLYYLIQKLEDGNVYVVWDGEKSKEWRRTIFSDYKAVRSAGFDPGFSHVKTELIAVLYDYVGVKQVMVEGYEADDIIAHLAKSSANAYIVSTDRDFWQLIVDDKIKIYLSNGKIIGLEDLQKETGCVDGREFLYCKALAGDSSDGIPGVKGVGMKRALQIVRTNTIDKYKDIFERNMRLIELNRPVENLKIVSKKSDLSGFVNWSMTYKFQSLIEVAEDFLNCLEESCDGGNVSPFRKSD